MAYQRKKGPAFNTASRTIGSGGRGRPIGRLRTIDEAAEVLNTSSRTVRRLIASGALRVHRIRQHLPRISDAALQALLDETSSD